MIHKRARRTFYFRMRVSSDLRELMGKTEIIPSLKTIKSREAKRREYRYRIQLENLYFFIRERVGTMSRELIQNLANQYLVQLFDNGEEHRISQSSMMSSEEYEAISLAYWELTEEYQNDLHRREE